MRIQVILKILGVLLIFFSSTMLPPVLVSLIYDDANSRPFIVAYTITLLVGLLCWLPSRRFSRDLKYRDGFLIVVLFWTVLASFGTIPFLPLPDMSVSDAFFESMSGLTTTGATILSGIDELPPSILYYRQQLQWLGGMGIIVLAVAVMPMLGIGGMQLYRAETPGPMKDSKLTPRITETAKALWYIYLGLTVLCALAYWAAGMSLFDAVCHSFSTVAIGGFSTHDLSLGYFQGKAVGLVAMVFMILAGMNFALHFVAWRKKTATPYWNDPEVRIYLAILGGVSVFTVALLHYEQAFESINDTLYHGVFHVISVLTTSGFTTTGFHWWPSLLPLMLIILSTVGGCAGSTAGGMKVIRAILLYKQGRRELVKLVHPNALVPIKLGGKKVPDHILTSVWGFFVLFTLCYVVFALLLTATGVDPITAFSSVTATLTNLGPALGESAENYASMNDNGKWILCFTMLLGRLELFTILVIFSRTFWRG